MKKIHENYLNIEKEFFELDEEHGIAIIRKEYGNPGDIIDAGSVTKTPRMTDDFIEDLIGTFDDLPARYKVHFLITFDELEGYSEAQMEDICRKNILLETKTCNRIAHDHNRLALNLCLTGVIFILLSIWINSIWKEESILRDIAAYVLDIAATVPFWAAIEIYFIDNSERRRKLLDLKKRFAAIEFRQKT